MASQYFANFVDGFEVRFYFLLLKIALSIPWTLRRIFRKKYTQKVIDGTFQNGIFCMAVFENLAHSADFVCLNY
jgi:hypothetical protein